MSDITLFGIGPLPWIDVILLIWFGLTALSVAYVAWDAFTNNPEMTIMKWGWVLVTLYLGQWATCSMCSPAKSPTPVRMRSSSAHSESRVLALLCTV